MKFKIKYYKYFCHIHTKKSKHDTILGYNWRSYLYENLLGNKEIISEILVEFEKYDKLGFILPEVYYDIIKDIDNYDSIEFPLHKPNVKYMNFILEKLFPGFTVGNKLIFPTGDMFWAKISAIHQIFKIRFKKIFPKELNQTNETIMHGIERIWLYIVKLNGYYFKIIFNHF
jgi:lipopolysaccharide biosynthesis protein